MAQNLLKFETENDYRTAKINHLIVPNISYINESGDTYVTGVMSNRLEAEAGDIIAFDKGDNSMTFIKPEAFTKEMLQTYTPVAVVVIPQSHTNDNKVVGMSLMAMSKNSPVTGSNINTATVWGSGFEMNNKHDYVVCVNIEDNNNPSATIANAIMSYLPSDSFYNDSKSIDNIVDMYSKWNKAARTYTPSPYLLDGTQSQRYTTDLLDNALNDFSIKDFNDEFASAGNICQKYNVPIYKGVGEWYLPPMGELGYLAVRAERVSYALLQLNSARRGLVATLDVLSPYWSSTLTTDKTAAWCVNLSNGLVASSSVDNTNFVRAFARF